jgi:Hypothetical glycosyl hydrolase family 15
MNRLWAIGVTAVLIAGALGAAFVVLGDDDEGGGNESVGQVRFLRSATTAFDPHLIAAEEDPALQRFWDAHYWRLRGFAPFYDRHTFDGSPPWSPPPTHLYKDLYAIYNNGAGRKLIAQHPDWVLRDAEGSPLFIPFECSRGSCPQYAGDVGSPAFRAHWIAGARRALSEGYAGIHIDDVNLAMRVSDGTGDAVRPIDTRTGRPMTDADWRRYVAEFTEQVRAEFPKAEVVHNAIWFVNRELPEVARAAAAADYVELERGATDPGISPGDGEFGFENFLQHIDWLHDRRVGVILEPYGLDEERRQFELAVYFLTGDGNDAIASSFEADPDNWWPGWEADLGAPEGEREIWNGLLRREFADGLVLVNPPGSPVRDVTLEGEYQDLDGEPVTSLSLEAPAGIVLREVS